MAVTSSGDMNYLTIGANSYKVVDPDALHSVPIATNETVGGVKGGGSGISIAADGTISSTAAGQMVWYGTCNTTASTAAKVVTCSGYTLQTGSIIGILFTTANTAATPTLNINSTTAKSIYVGTATPNSTTNVLKWSVNTMIYFMYDGTAYRYITSISAGDVVPSRGANTWYGTSSTGATTTAKTSTIDNFVLTKGALVSITFSSANTVNSSAITLNINSTGAKTIYYNNSATSATNKLLWDPGETLTFIYTGSYYYFVCKSKIPVATSSTLGGVKAGGAGITIHSDGVIENPWYFNGNIYPVHIYAYYDDSTILFTLDDDVDIINEAYDYGDIPCLMLDDSAYFQTGIHYLTDFAVYGSNDEYRIYTFMWSASSELGNSGAISQIYTYVLTLDTQTGLSYTRYDTSHNKIGPFYATSSTTASTAIKQYSSNVGVGEDHWIAGTLLVLNFSTANTVEDLIQLRYGSTGTAIPIYYNDAATSSSNSLLWDAGEILTFVYSNSKWYFVSRSKSGGSVPALTNTEIDNAVAAAVTVANGNNIQY